MGDDIAIASSQTAPELCPACRGEALGVINRLLVSYRPLALINFVKKKALRHELAPVADKARVALYLTQRHDNA